MRIRTILNQEYSFKSFVYARERFKEIDGRCSLVIDVIPRKNSKPICSGCDLPAPIYDHQGERFFRHLPLWSFIVYLCYVMRRVDCKRCGIKIEKVPWADGKSRTTKAFQLFLSRWAKRLSWLEASRIFLVSWDTVFDSVKNIVDYGLQRQSLKDIEAIGVDEVQYQKGHKYMTLVYQIEKGKRRLLYIAKDRTTESLSSFFDLLGETGRNRIQYVCSDMWKPYLKAIKECLPKAINILDRFHIVAMLNKATDEVRREEANRLSSEGYEPILKNSKYCFLKNPDNLSIDQKARLDELMQYDLKSVEAYLLKESFQGFWEYVSPAWAEKYVDRWCTRVMRSKLEPMKKHDLS